MAYVDGFMVAIHEESPVESEAFLRREITLRVGRMGIRFFYPMWSTDRATPASESLGWFFSDLCALRGIDGSSGLVISKTKTA